MKEQFTRWRWLAALLAGVLFWYLSMILGAFATFPFGGSLQEINGPPLVVFAVTRAILTALGIALAAKIVGLKLPDLGLQFERWQADALIGLAVGVLMPLIQFALVIPNTGGAARSDVIASRALLGDGVAGLIAAITVGWLVGGFAEELFYRGFLIATLKNVLGNGRLSLVLAVILSTLYFANSHAYQGWIGMLDTGIAALIWAGLYLWRGRLIAGIVAHGLNDMLLLIGLYLWY